MIGKSSRGAGSPGQLEVIDHCVRFGECPGNAARRDLHEEKHVALLVGGLALVPEQVEPANAPTSPSTSP